MIAPTLALLAAPVRRHADHDPTTLAVEKRAQRLAGPPKLRGRPLEFEGLGFTLGDELFKGGEVHEELSFDFCVEVQN